MDTGNVLFDFAHDTNRVQLEQMRGTQARNALHRGLPPLI